MKKSTFFVLSLLLVASLPGFAAINYTITFSGTGASTTVESVIVQNLTKGTTVTVPAGNVLNLNDAPNAVEQMNANDETIRVYTNSVEGKSTVSFFAKQAGSTQINAFNIDGRKIAGITANLQAGMNSFQLSLPKGSFVIQVTGNGYTYSSKMINQSASLSKTEIVYVGAEKQASFKPQKSKSSALGTTTMTYNTGDRLLYTGISGIYSTVVTDVPIAGKTINFDFVACTDVDGNNYKVVKIGTQTWMAENLKTTKYNDGTAIPYVTDNTAWYNLSTPAYCWYNNDSTTYKNTYGVLYNWYAVNTAKLAPTGWHVPTDVEWTTLKNYVIANLDISHSVSKALAATTNWTYSTSYDAIGNNLTRNNSSGFSALPGGYRGGTGNGAFHEGGNSCTWWSSPQHVTDYAWPRGLSYSYYDVYRFEGYSSYQGFSMRCVRD
ncbi:MAG: FISUMP domain-containing protein [Paludibacter sp.]